MNKRVCKIVSKSSRMLHADNNGQWDRTNPQPITLYRAFNERNQEVMFDINKDKLIKRLNQSGYTIECQ